MMYENDKFVIPDEYRKMSVSELRSKKERLYKQLKSEQPLKAKKTSTFQGIAFKF